MQKGRLTCQQFCHINSLLLYHQSLGVRLMTSWAVDEEAFVVLGLCATDGIEFTAIYNSVLAVVWPVC